MARLRGDLENISALMEQAFEKEAEAARRMAADPATLEPTRSVLLRSAAALALECNKIREAEQLISTALAGNPPSEIAEELRDLLERAYFQRHLMVKGVSLQEGEFQLSLAGSGVGAGLAPSEIFLTTIQGLQMMVLRTVQRLAHIDWEENLNLTRAIKDYSLFVSAPMRGSVAVSFKIGRPNQPQLPGFDNSANVINEILTGVELVNNGEEEALRERIPDPAYHRNFVALVRKIAPDGEYVSLVGLTTKDRKVALTRPQAKIQLTGRRYGARELVRRTGQLRYADATRTTNSLIKLSDTEGNWHTIRVPPGMMNDIVRPLWDETVTVTGVQLKKMLRLVSIDKAEH